MNMADVLTRGGARNWIKKNGVGSIVCFGEYKLQREPFNNVYVYFSYVRHIRLHYFVLVHHG